MTTSTRWIKAVWQDRDVDGAGCLAGHEPPAVQEQTNVRLEPMPRRLTAFEPPPLTKTLAGL